MRFYLISLLVLSGLFSYAQKKQDTIYTKRLVDSINRLLDRSIVNKDSITLKNYYAEDFYFQHATGRIDSRASWLKSVQKNNYKSREHDSVIVELHDNVAIVTGSLKVLLPPGAKKSYGLTYIRVFAYKNKRWQLISHHSTGEWEIKD